SVLISLISDTSSTRGLYIKWIFGTGSRKRGLLRPLHASTRYCSVAGNGALLSVSKNRIHSQEALALPRAENFAPPRSVSSLQSSWASSEFSLLYYIFKYINTDRQS